MSRASRSDRGKPDGASAQWRGCRVNAITVCLAGALTLVSLSARGSATYFVTNCGDTGAGSLRTSISSAASGDTIDLTQLPLVCSTITLSQAVLVPQADLTLIGPGASKVLVNANGVDRVFDHSGTGTLAISDISMANGYAYSIGANVEGGCMRSSGSLKVTRVRIDTCTAESYNGTSHGGVIAAAKNTEVYYSTLTNGYAFSFNSSTRGGAIYVGAAGTLVTDGATISANRAWVRPGTGGVGRGGGIDLYGATSANIAGSTISGNSASSFGGAITTCCDFTLAVDNSTISGNVAGSAGVSGIVGGIAAASLVNMANSTVVFNRADAGFTFTGANAKQYQAPGLDVSSSGIPGQSVTVQSSLIANNTYSGTENDFSFDVISAHPVVLSGTSSNNLIRVSSNGLPAGTLAGVCPLLGPLRDNGGPAATHALLSGSPGIDAGSNPYSFTNDERGPLYAGVPVYPRSSGTAPDIGAYEVQQGDVLFNTGFDGCPAL